MMRRLAFGLLALPFACWIYACSDDPKEEPGNLDDGGGTDSTTPEKDSGNTQPDSNFNFDASDDGGDGGVETCTGNPLTADGGGLDAVVDSGLTQIATGNFLDGPHYVDQYGGVFIYSEVFNQRVRRVQPDGGGDQIMFGTGNGNTLVIGNATIGSILYTAQTGNGAQVILRKDLATDGGDAGNLAVAPAVSPNDVVASKKGFIYFTDPGYQGGATFGVYRLSPGDGGITPVATGTTQKPDGIALSPAEDFLYVAHGDTRTVVKYPVDANGGVGAASQPVFTATDLPVGIAVDSGGNLWVAESNQGGANSGRVSVVDPTGKKWGEIPFATSRPTNVAFGGPDNKLVAITTETGGTPSGFHIYKSRCAGVR